MGFVFQNYALYPHLSVERNLSLALETRRVPRAEISSRVAEAAKLLGLAKLLARRPRQLSGGEQQRVALGRALVKRPRIYLMDEPLSNLDALLREGMRSELRALFGRLGATVLYVTHDQGEALALSDEVLVMKEGRALQSGAPLELYRRPADLFTATFVGSPRMTIWRGRAENGAFAGRGVRLPLPDGIAERELCVGIRPEDVETGVDASSRRLRRGRDARRARGRPRSRQPPRRRRDPPRSRRSTRMAGKASRARGEGKAPRLLGGDREAARTGQVMP